MLSLTHDKLIDWLTNELNLSSVLAVFMKAAHHWVRILIYFTSQTNVYMHIQKDDEYLYNKHF